MTNEELKILIRELIKTELEEVNSLAARGSGATFTAGAGEAYATPYAFKRKRKRKNK